LRFDTARATYHAGRNGLGIYLKKLFSICGQEKEIADPALQQFLAAYRMESTLDFNQVEQERRVVLNQLTQRLTAAEVSTLVSQSVAYRAGALGFGDYFRSLQELCEQKRIHLDRTPAFNSYVRYALLSDGIQAGALSDSVVRLEEKIQTALIK